MHHERKVKRDTNKMQLIRCLFQLSISTCLGHHYAHIQENKTVYYRIWCSALVVLAVVVWSCVHRVKDVVGSNNNFHTVHTACDPAPHSHNQCRTPYAVIHGLVLLMMGIMVPETCWYRSLIINIWLVASCWFLSLHPTFMMHSHTSLKFFVINGSHHGLSDQSLTRTLLRIH